MLLLLSLVFALVPTTTFASPVHGNGVIERTTSAPITPPFNLNYLFTAHLTLGKPLPTIPVPGGVLVPEPIVGGIVSGPAINATITGGIATPSIYNNGTVQVPVIEAWGVTSDGFGFVINQEGIGMPKGQVTRIVSAAKASKADASQKPVVAIAFPFYF
jgi:hypothetical protein